MMEWMGGLIKPSLFYFVGLSRAVRMEVFSFRFEIQILGLDLESFVMNVQMQMRKRGHVHI